MSETEFVLPAFLETLERRSPEALGRFLDDRVVYSVEGLAPIVGRAGVMAFWRRLFAVHTVVRASHSRFVRDGPLIIAAQHQVYRRPNHEPIEIASVALYELASEKILIWQDAIAIEALPARDRLLWARLRDARW